MGVLSLVKCYKVNRYIRFIRNIIIKLSTHYFLGYVTARVLPRDYCPFDRKPAKRHHFQLLCITKLARNTANALFIVTNPALPPSVSESISIVKRR